MTGGCVVDGVVELIEQDLYPPLVDDVRDVEASPGGPVQIFSVIGADLVGGRTRRSLHIRVNMERHCTGRLARGLLFFRENKH